VNLSFIFEPGPIPFPRGEVDLEEPALDSLPLAPDFGSPPFLVGGWQPEGEFDLPEDSEFTPWELPFKGNVELEPDISVDAWARDVNGFELPDSAKPKITDISKGLGKRRDRVDLVALQKFVAQSQRFILLGDQLCVYYPPCWRKLSDLEAEREIRALIESHNKGTCLTLPVPFYHLCIIGFSHSFFARTTLNFHSIDTIANIYLLSNFYSCFLPSFFTHIKTTTAVAIRNSAKSISWPPNTSNS